MSRNSVGSAKELFMFAVFVCPSLAVVVVF
jgi:hypothetical protein